MKAIAEPKLGSWDLGDLVKDPNGSEFKEFLETIKESVTELIYQTRSSGNRVSSWLKIK
jgi:hypothetical protein